MVATRRSSAGAKAEEPKRTRPPPAVTQPGFWRSFATRAKAARYSTDARAVEAPATCMWRA